MKKNKRIAGFKRAMIAALAAFVFLTVSGRPGASVTAFAEDRKGQSGWEVSFNGKKMTSNFTSANMGDEINAMQPGDSVELTITLRNAFDGKADWYMKNEVLQALEDAGDAAGGAYDYLLTYTDAAGETSTLYSSEKFGGDGRINGVGLHGATKTLEDYFYLERMGKDAKGTVKLKVALDGETLVNNYQNTYAKLQMDFATELVEGEGGTTPASPSPNRPGSSSSNREIIKTGDQARVTLYMTLMLAAGMVLLLLAIIRLRRDQEEALETETAADSRIAGRTGNAGRRRGRTASLLVLLMMFLTIGQNQTVLAADGPYTYTVRLYAGNLGELTGEGFEIQSDTARVTSDEDQVVISGLQYGDTVRIIYQEAAVTTDERYYVRGVRRSGRDNSEAEAPTFNVASDRDYVVAYGVSGDMVSYTVNYLDTDGDALMPSATYYGNAGERQYVSSCYIDGYQPQALNLVRTLSANESENVFDFRYTPVPAETVETPAAPTAPTTPAATTTTTTTVAPTAPATPTPAATPAAAPAATPTPADAGTPEAEPNEEEGVGGDAGVQVPDEEVPQANAPEDVVDLDDDEVPLASMEGNQGRMIGYLPVYIGIGIAAVLALAGTAIYLKKRRMISAGVEEIAEDAVNHEER